MQYENILVETHGKVGLVRLNRPKALNALNDALIDELGHALLAFDSDRQIGCMVITGSEKAFAAGADIGAMAGYSYMDAFKGEYITRNWEKIRQIRKPVIAAVSGFALGGGCELAMMCDLSSQQKTPGSVSPRSSSASCRARAERSACHVQSPNPKQWICA